MRAFALAEIGDSEAIDVFLRREDAWAALAEILEDEPDWAGSLFVVPIELDERKLAGRTRPPGTACQAALQSGAALPLVHLGELPSEVSHHVERYGENVLPRSDTAGVGREDLSYRATGEPQRPHL